MLYTDLDKIPLDTFIDVFTGDKKQAYYRRGTL